MNLRGKFVIIFLVILIFSVVTSFLWHKYLNSTISKYTSGQMQGMEGVMGIKSTPVFQSGFFTEDGNYFVYTYQPEVEKPDVDGSITMRGFAYPPYFQVIDCNTGKKLLKKPFDGEKYNQLYVLWEQDGLVWLMKDEYHKGNLIALYDLKANKFRFSFGELEKLNPEVSWRERNRYLLNTSSKKGLIVEANDLRNYLIDPNTGKAEIIQGRFDLLDFGYTSDYQVSNLNFNKLYDTKQINGGRESIVSKKNMTVSADDFIEVQYLALSRNKKMPDHPEITFYKDNFFVLSPVNADDKVKMELAMLDRNTLKTTWKLQLPQERLKTFTSHYGYERFFIKGDQLLASNNNYLMTVDLRSGKIVKQENLYE